MKSIYIPRQQGLELRVGVVAGEGLGDTAGAPQAESLKDGLFLEEVCVGDCTGDTTPK